MKEKLVLSSKIDKYNRIVGGQIKLGIKFFEFNPPTNGSTIMHEHFTNTSHTIYKLKENFGRINVILVEVEIS